MKYLLELDSDEQMYLFGSSTSYYMRVLEDYSRQGGSALIRWNTGAIFGIFWLAYHRCYLTALFVPLALGIVLGSLTNSIILTEVISIVVWGFFGNAVMLWNLNQKVASRRRNRKSLDNCRPSWVPPGLLLGIVFVLAGLLGFLLAMFFQGLASLW